MGVVTDTDIDYGRIFGPFPAVGHIPQAQFIGLLTSDERNDTQNIKINLNDRSLGNTWLPYVHPARTGEEQNVEAYIKDGLIYYRTLRIIRAGEELLVWYSKDFGQILEIPEIKGHQKHDDNSFYTCEKCSERFRYLYPLIAHVRFKCTGNDIDKREQVSPGTSHSKSRDIGSRDSIQTLKRSAGEDITDLTNKRLIVEVQEENNNDKIPRKVSPALKSGTDESESVSAFRKVEKSHAEDIPISSIGSGNSSFNVINAKADKHTSSLYNRNVTLPGKYNDNMNPGLGMLLPSWFVHQSAAGQPYIDPRLYAERLQATQADSKLDNINRGNTITSSGIRGFTANEIFNRQNIMLMEQLRKTPYPAAPTANPMVEKLLTTASAPTLLQRPLQQLNLAQNWCAKCNATFRMTSDLVYHMRSHHKREFDPMKRKREDKLQCSVCKETFKERHHLTRHMTSHT